MEPEVRDQPRPDPTLGRSFAWMLAGNLVFAASQWAMLAGLAKLTTAETVGTFNFGLAATAPVALLFGLGLRSLQATDARGQFPFSTYYGLQLACSAATVVVSLVIALLSGQTADTRLVIGIIAVSKACTALSEVLYGLLQKHERMATVARSLIGRGLLSLLALLCVVGIWGDLVAGCTAMAAAGLLVLLAYDLPRSRALEPVAASRRLGDLRALFVTALPLGLVSMLISLNANLPVYFIQNLHGEAAVGYFAAINYIGISGNLFVTAVAQVMAPRLGRLHAARERKAFRSFLHRAMGVGAGIGAAGALVSLAAGEPLLTLLYNAEYARYTDVFTVLMVGYGFGYAAAFVGVSLTAQRNLRTMLGINVATVALNAAACFCLVPGWGILGAAGAGVLSQAFKLGANYTAARLAP